jgi:hypothetical protein
VFERFKFLMSQVESRILALPEEERGRYGEADVVRQYEKAIYEAADLDAAVKTDLIQIVSNPVMYMEGSIRRAWGLEA